MRKMIGVGVLLLLAAMLAYCSPGEKMEGVKVLKFSYVNDYVSIYLGSGENQMVVGGLTPYGGGGAVVCCYSIPDKWRADYKVPVKWVVPGKEEDTWEEHTVEVPIEPYPDDAWDALQVHVLPDYSIKLIVSEYGPGNPNHPLHQLYLSQEEERAEYDKQYEIEQEKYLENLKKQERLEAEQKRQENNKGMNNE